MSYMFNNCSNLSTLPDISKWNTNNVNNIIDMFADCNNNLVIPSKFKQQKTVNQLFIKKL